MSVRIFILKYEYLLILVDIIIYDNYLSYMIILKGTKVKEWNQKVKHFLKSELIRRGLTNEDLVSLLSQIGISETKASVDNKISRASFSATFLLQCLYAMNYNDLQKSMPLEKYSQTELSNIVYNTDLFVSPHNSDKYRHKSGTQYIDINDFAFNPLTNKKIVSLFTGAGGLEIGLEMVGFETCICVEIDDDCRETLKHNRPNWLVYEDSKDGIKGDIRAIEPTEILEASKLDKGEAAIVSGGAPCQPFSNIGKKNGASDPKNGDLFMEFVRIVKGIMPKAFIFENVAGITQSKHSEVVNYMKHAFNGLGYGIDYKVLNAADYGVSQRRERFFLIGIHGIEKPAFPLPTHYKGLSEWQKFISELDHAPNYSPKPWIKLKAVLDMIPKDNVKRNDYALMNISDKVRKRMELVGPGENFKVLPKKMLPNCWKSGRHQGQDTFGRLRLDEPSVTIRTAAYNPAKGKYIHPTENRGLSTIEMAAIQDFPYEWEFKVKNGKKVTLVSGGRQIGNAVPPSLAKAIGIAIKKQL